MRVLSILIVFLAGCGHAIHYKNGTCIQASYNMGNYSKDEYRYCPPYDDICVEKTILNLPDKKYIAFVRVDECLWKQGD